MSPRPDVIDPRLAAAREALRALARPAPEPGYRERVKQGFVAGTLTSPASAPGRVLRLPRPAWRWAILVPAAAAALVVAGMTLNRGPVWSRVSPAAGAGSLSVDGRPIALDREGDLARALRPGAHVRLAGEAPVDFALRGQMVMRLMPGSEVVMPAAAGRWWGREVRAEVAYGEIRVVTGDGFHGARLMVGTPEAEVKVTGTTLAVIREPHGTCVCVMEGRVEMGPRGAPMAGIEAGRRRFVFNDGRAPEHDVMRPVEQVELAALARQYRGALSPGRR